MDEPAEITIPDHGPIKIRGRFIIKDAKGQEYDLSGRSAIALCRCGQSNNKPFCDGTHRSCGFESAVVARKLPPLS